MKAEQTPDFSGELRKHLVKVPETIYLCRGMRIFGRRIKSIIFTTDLAIIRNSNADAVLAVYPFTPQPVITHSLMLAADTPVFCGVGGGTTTGQRVVELSKHAEFKVRWASSSTRRPRTRPYAPSNRPLTSPSSPPLWTRARILKPGLPPAYPF